MCVRVRHEEREEERADNNNHGQCRDAQLVYLIIFTNFKQKAILNEVKTSDFNSIPKTISYEIYIYLSLDWRLE